MQQGSVIQRAAGGSDVWEFRRSEKIGAAGAHIGRGSSEPWSNTRILPPCVMRHQL